MRDVTRQLQDYWTEIASRLPEPSLEAAFRESVGEGDVRLIQPRRPARRWPAWATVAVASGLVLLCGVLAWLLLPYGGTRPFVDEGPSLTTIPIPASTIPAPAAWDPILSTTRAKILPPAATCPPGTDPQAPGPADQPRPDSDIWSNQAAVFDRHTGRIIHIDATGATWAFDVCTNTWQELDPVVIPAESRGSTPLSGNAELVYDVDSDRTVAFGEEAVAVYDAADNTWTVRRKPTEYRDTSSAGAVYDPVSGLIVLQVGGRGVVAYDVDTDTWTFVGNLSFCCTRMIYDPDAELWSPAEPEPCYPNLVGYAASTDEFVFLESDNQLVNPRTGARATIEDPPLSPFSYWGRAFGRAHYAVGADTAYITAASPGEVCRLDAEHRRWTCADFTGDPTIDHYEGFVARVGDTIHHRIVLIDGYCCGGFSTDLPEQHNYDVWAIDMDTGEWVQLLAPVG
jgi:hypothetical protein